MNDLSASRIRVLTQLLIALILGVAVFSAIVVGVKGEGRWVPWEAVAGFVADAWSVRGAIVSGGFACVGGVFLTAAMLGDFWSYDNRTDEHAIEEKAAREERAQG